MKESQKLTLRLEKAKARLNEIAGLADDQVTDEIRAEEETRQGECRESLRKLETALIAEGDAESRAAEAFTDDAETRALRDLESRSRVSDIFDAALEHRATDGPTAELQKHLGLSANQVPLALLRELETRAVTPAPSDVGQNQQAIIPGVFPQSAAAFLGVDMPTVGVGEAVFPVLTTNATVHTPAENAAAAETTGSFSADVLSPARLQASFVYSREDRARFAGMDAALRMNLSDALADALDKQVISGTNGLLAGTNLASHNVTAQTSFALARSQLAYGRVDGTYAGTVGDIRVLLGSHSYAHLASQYRANGSDMSALDHLARETGGIRVSAHVPAQGNDGAKQRQQSVVRLGMRRDMVAPIWEGVTLIPDEVTKAASGQIVVTAVMLHAVKILRAAGFYKQQIQPLA